jgi:hypothetical protein
MGTLYYAVGKNNRQAMELGKCSFDFLLRRKFDDFETLCMNLKTHFTENFYSEECLESRYIRTVAHKLLSIDNEFEVVYDGASSKAYEGVVIVSSRYSDDTSSLGELLSSRLSD